MGKANKKEQNDFNKLIINEKEEKNIKLSKVRKFLGIDKQKEEKLKIENIRYKETITKLEKELKIAEKNLNESKVKILKKWTDIISEENENYSNKYDELDKKLSEVRSDYKDSLEAKKDKYPKLGLFARNKKKELSKQMKALSFNYEQEENNLIQEILQMKEENVDVLNEKTNAMKQEVYDLERKENAYIKELKLQIEEEIQRHEDEIRKYESKGFGRYPITQGGKPEGIKWKILKSDGNKALIITEKAIECMKYNEKYEPINWSECTLRKWLNDEFLNKAFTEEERSLIINSSISNKSMDEDVEIDWGLDTTDRIFLLSVYEAEMYFESEEDRCAIPTKLAKAKGAYVEDCGENKGNTSWWLRSLGYDDDTSASIVSYDGYIDDIGYSVNDEEVAIRPALWIKLE